jgi:F0F1-type ATP synthase assembly protein I
MRLPETNDRQRAMAAAGRAQGLETGMQVSSYLIGGLVAYGLIGWLIGYLIHASWPVPAGMLLGLAISTGYVIYRYGRPHPEADSATPETPATSATPHARKESR